MVFLMSASPCRVWGGGGGNVPEQAAHLLCARTHLLATGLPRPDPQYNFIVFLSKNSNSPNCIFVFKKLASLTVS